MNLKVYLVFCDGCNACDSGRYCFGDYDFERDLLDYHESFSSTQLWSLWLELGGFCLFFLLRWYQLCPKWSFIISVSFRRVSHPTSLFSLWTLIILFLNFGQLLANFWPVAPTFLVAISFLCVRLKGFYSTQLRYIGI